MVKQVFLSALSIVCLAGAAVEQIAIEKIDKNFVKATVKGHPVQYYDVLTNPNFSVTGFGFRKPGEPLYRFPDAWKNDKKISNGLRYMAKMTTGGKIRFRTDSKYIALRADVHWAPGNGENTRMSSSFDLFIKTPKGWMYRGVAVPGAKNLRGEEIFEAMILRPQWNQTMRDIEINLPTYNGVRTLEIGVMPGAGFEPPAPFDCDKPVVFYGSSITHGANPSRPGNNFTTMLCRRLNVPQVNLGFSGGAKGEPFMAELIAKLDMSVFVLDYDHNAPSVEHLQKTHEAFFKTIRKAHPDLPVIILSWDISPKRTAVIRKTYENAAAAGDKNVYFIDGAEYFASLEDPLMGTSDGCHPNDLGFYLMYQRILPVLQKALQAKTK